jgi:hypothetical protein
MLCPRCAISRFDQRQSIFGTTPAQYRRHVHKNPQISDCIHHLVMYDIIVDVIALIFMDNLLITSYVV